MGSRNGSAGGSAGRVRDDGRRAARAFAPSQEKSRASVALVPGRVLPLALPALIALSAVLPACSGGDAVEDAPAIANSGGIPVAPPNAVGVQIETPSPVPTSTRRRRRTRLPHFPDDLESPFDPPPDPMEPEPAPLPTGQPEGLEL